LVSASTDNADVSIFASKRDDGALTLMLINRSPNEATRRLQLIGFTPQSVAEVWRFDETHNAEKIGSQKIEDGASITVPPYSMTLLVVP